MKFPALGVCIGVRQAVPCRVKKMRLGHRKIQLMLKVEDLGLVYRSSIGEAT